MKTFIVNLEDHDDIVSAKDKMGWAKSGRILLVWPDHGRLLNRRLDLLLLGRHSASLGAPLALVTKDPEVHYYAPRLGIPVFTSLKRAQRAHWRVPRRFRKPQPEGDQATSGETAVLQEWNPDLQLLRSRPEGKDNLVRPERGAPKIPTFARLVFFTLGVLALLSIAATLLPSTRIILSPQTMSQEITLEVLASPAIRTISLSGTVPAREATVTVEGRDSQPVSGAIQLPDRAATGYVSFTNLTDQPVEVPEGTVVRTLGDPSKGENPIRFTVSRAGEVPVGAGEAITLPVRCLTPGSQGNLPANSLVALEGLLGTQLSITNSAPTQNGTERRELAPTQADRRKLDLKLRQDLGQTALKEIQSGLKEGDVLIPSSLELSRVLEESYQPAEQTPADRLSLSQRLEFQVTYVSEEDLHSLAAAVLDASLPEGFAPVEGSLEVINLSEPVLGEDSIARWKLQAKRQAQAQLPEPETVRLVLGLEPSQAKARLEAALPLKEPPQVILFPSWWPRLPFMPFRIVIIVT